MVSLRFEDAYRAARDVAALVDRADRGRIVLSGADRASYLQGLLTNDIVALKSGEGCYTAYLTPQGRMIADAYVYELGDVMLLSTPRAVTPAVVAKLDQFVFTEDVKIGDDTDHFAQMPLLAPTAAATLARVLGGIERAALIALAEHGNPRAQFAQQPVIVTQVTHAGEPAF